MSDTTDKDQLIEGHDYDGIQELDNPLPRWWLNLFYVTIVFAVAYYSYYEIFGGPSSDVELAKKLDSLKQLAIQAEQLAPGGDDVNVNAILADSAKLETGQKAFVQFCAACHGTNGEGLIGPNLVDQYWMHSKGDYAGILKALREGFPAKGMPPWRDVVPKDQHALVVAYILSIKGTKPANAKAPQGELVQ